MHSVHLDSAEILYAIYRDKSDLFDVYCKKVYFLQLVCHVFANLILLFLFNYFVIYVTTIHWETEHLYYFACKETVQLKQSYTALECSLFVVKDITLYMGLVIKWSTTVLMKTITMLLISWWAL